MLILGCINELLTFDDLTILIIPSTCTLTELSSLCACIIIIEVHNIILIMPYHATHVNNNYTCMHCYTIHVSTILLYIIVLGCCDPDRPPNVTLACPHNQLTCWLPALHGALWTEVVTITDYRLNLTNLQCSIYTQELYRNLSRVHIAYYAT